jgi:hypothetical protein
MPSDYDSNKPKVRRHLSRPPVPYASHSHGTCLSTHIICSSSSSSAPPNNHLHSHYCNKLSPTCYHYQNSLVQKHQVSSTYNLSSFLVQTISNCRRLLTPYLTTASSTEVDGINSGPNRNKFMIFINYKKIDFTINYLGFPGLVSSICLCWANEWPMIWTAMTSGGEQTWWRGDRVHYPEAMTIMLLVLGFDKGNGEEGNGCLHV